MRRFKAQFSTINSSISRIFRALTTSTSRRRVVTIRIVSISTRENFSLRRLRFIDSDMTWSSKSLELSLKESRSDATDDNEETAFRFFDLANNQSKKSRDQNINQSRNRDRHNLLFFLLDLDFLFFIEHHIDSVRASSTIEAKKRKRIERSVTIREEILELNHLQSRRNSLFRFLVIVACFDCAIHERT